MKKVFLFLSVVLCMLGQSFGQSKVSSGLQMAAQSAQPNEKIPVVITLADQLDLSSLQPVTRFMQSDERLRVSVEALKQFSKNSQQDLLQLLAEASGQVSDVHSFWLFNGITCRLTKDMIDALSDRQDVLSVEYDPESEAAPFEAKEVEIDRSYTGNWSIGRLHADQVWEMGYTGKNIVVAIIDSGVRYDHVGLSGNMWDGGSEFPNHGVNYGTNSYNNPVDGYGRGTIVAGLVAGKNPQFLTGIAPDSKIMALKVTNNSGQGANLDKISSAMQFAISHGAKVVLITTVLAGSEQAQSFLTLMNQMNGLKIVAITAAGDAGQTATAPYCIASPSNCPSPWHNPDEPLDGIHSANICVGATDKNDYKLLTSSVGPVTWDINAELTDYPYTAGSATAVGHIRPDISAPGSEIISLGIDASSGVYDHFSQVTVGSTAYAAAHVAGVVALLLEADSTLTPADIDRLLETSAVKCEGMSVKNNYYGAGRVDALAAINALLSTVNPVTDLAASVDQNTVTLTWTEPEGAESYDVYCNEELLESAFIGNTYTHETTHSGNHVYYLISNAEDGSQSVRSNYATAFISPDGPVVTHMSATVSGNQVTLSWETPSSAEYFRYGDAETAQSSGIGNGSSKSYWAQRFLSADLVDYSGNAIDTVSIYLRVAGSYNFKVYDGTPNGIDTKLFEKSFSVTSAQVPGWYHMAVGTPIPVPADKDIWFMASTTATNPVAWCNLSPTNRFAALFSSNGTDWSPYIMEGTIAWMMKAHLTGGDFTYNIFRDGVEKGHGVDALTFVENNVPNGIHYYTITTNYNNNQNVSVPSEPLRVNVNIKYTVTFAAGSGTSTSSITQSAPNAPITLPTATPSAACQNSGYTFAGWSTEIIEGETEQPELLLAGSSYEPQDNITLYAVYENIQGGGWAQARTLNSGDVVCIVGRDNDGHLYEFSGFTSNSLGEGTAFTNAPAGLYPFEVSYSGGMAMFMNSDGQYLRKINNKGNLSFGTAINASTKWNVTIINGKAFMRNSYASKNHQMALYLETFDNNAPRFIGMTYEGGMPENALDVIIYRYSESTFHSYDHSPSCSSSLQPPVITPVAEGVYLDSVRFTITTTASDVWIRYTLDGSTPTSSSFLYVAPVKLTNTTTVKARVFKKNNNNENSAVTQQTYNFPTPYANIAAFKAAANTNQIAIINSTMRVTQQFDNYLYVSDDTGGLLLFDDFNFVDQTFVDGDYVGPLQGRYQVVNGQPMMVLWHSVEKTEGDSPVEPVTVSVQEINSNYNPYDAQLVRLEGVHFGESVADFNSGVVIQDSITLAALDKFSGVDCAVDTNYLYDVIGILGINNTEYRIYPRTNNDIRRYYNITCVSDGEGSMSVNAEAVSELSTVTVTANPVEGHHLASLYYYGSNPEVRTDIDLTSLQFAMPGENITVVAVFAEDVYYTVTFYKGSGVCDTPSLTETGWQSGVVLPAATPSPACASEGYTFVGWAESLVNETLLPPTLFQPETVYHLSEDVTLYAVYAIGGTEWVEVTDLAGLTEGDYVITSKYGTSSNPNSKKYYYLKREGQKFNPTAPQTTISAQGVPAASDQLWTIALINGDKTNPQYSITYTEDDVTYYLKGYRDSDSGIEVSTFDPGTGWEFNDNSTKGLMASFPTPVSDPDKAVRYLSLMYNGPYGSKWYFFSTNLYQGELHLFRAPSNTYVTNPVCHGFVENPVFENLPAGIIVSDTWEVVINHPDFSSVNIYYTTDGTDPTDASTPYTGAFEISESLTVKAIAIDNEGNSSDVVTQEYVFIPSFADIADFKTNATAGMNEVKIKGNITVVHQPEEGSILYVCDASAGLMVTDNLHIITNTYENGTVLTDGIFGRLLVDNGQKKLLLSRNPGEGVPGEEVSPEPVSNVYYFSEMDAEFVSVEQAVMQQDYDFSGDAIKFEVAKGSNHFYVYDLFGTLSASGTAGDYCDIIGFVGTRGSNDLKYLYPRFDADFVRYYHITCDETIEGGQVNTDLTQAKPGTLVTVTVTPDPGYEAVTIAVTYGDQQSLTLDENNRFEMPEGDVTITVSFEKTPYSFLANINPEINCGVVEVEEEGPYYYGDTLHITAIPNTGYQFGMMVYGGHNYYEPTLTIVVEGDIVVDAFFEVSTTTDETQVTTLIAGWDWFSSYVEYPENALELIENSITDAGATSAMIKPQAGGFRTLENGVWTGMMEPMANENMYLIQTDGLELSLTAPLADPNDHPITLGGGWNWIGYISSEAMSVVDALVGMNPEEGDMMKGQGGFTTFENGAWSSPLTLEPGHGYLYLNNGEVTTFTYPEASSKGYVVVIPVQTHWNADYHRFPTNLTMMVTLDADLFGMSEGSHEIAAFVNGECRGTALLHHTLGNHVAFLTVTGAQGEEVSFRLFDVHGNMEYGTADEQISYRANDIYGSAKNPMVLHFRNTSVNEYGQVSLFPNPTKGKVTILGQGIETVKVYNAMGQLLFTEEAASAEQVELDLSSLSTGVYTVNVRMTDGRQSNRMVVRE